jgi:hypothetical protein
MGRASSRPRSRRASGRACFASADAFVDVAGITAERAAEGSGSEWSSEEKEEEKETTEVVPLTPSGPRPEGVVGVDADAPLSNVSAPPTPASIRAETRRASRRASRRPPPPAASRGSKETHEPAVRVFLFTNEKGFETARPVTARLVVSAKPAVPRTEREVTYGDVLRAGSPRASTAPDWIGSIAERLAGHAGAWPAWDIRRSTKGKTLVATQLEDFASAVPYAPAEPQHDEDSTLSTTKASNPDHDGSCPPMPPMPPMPWSSDLSEADREARWRYEGGGMHQPVAEATPAERWVETEKKRKGNGGVSAVTASALETSAEVALAVDGERALSQRAAAAAMEVARAAREAGPLALSRRKRAKTPPASDTRLPLPAASLAASAGTSSKTFKTEADASVEKEKHTGIAAFSSAETSKLWGAWSPSVQRRRRRRLDAARVGGDDDAGDDGDDASPRGTPLPVNPKAESGESGEGGSKASTSRVGLFPKAPKAADGFSGRSSGYEEEDDPTEPPADSDDASSKTSSDFETPAATRDGTPVRDEEESC